MKIKITTDSACDLSPELIKKYNIGIRPVNVSVGDQDFLDGVNITTDQLFELIDKTGVLSKSAAGNPAQFEEFFKEQLASDGGYDYIIHIAISTELSCLGSNAQIASQEFDNKVFVIDGRALSTGTGLQLLYACDLVKKGLSAEDIYEKVLARRDSVQTSFILDNLNYLHKGGRCNLMSLISARFLSIKPVLLMKDGKLGVTKKLVGKFSSNVMKYVEYILSTFNTPDKTRVFLTYTTLEPALIEEIKKRLQQVFKEVLVTRAGCTVATHCGRNTVGILYYNDGK